MDVAGPGPGLGALQTTQTRLVELSRQFVDGELRDSDDDAIFVLRTATVNFKGAPALMDKTAAAMPLLDASQQAKAAQLSAAFAGEISALEAACRERDSGKQLDASKRATEVLSEYLAIATIKYSVPDNAIVPYSSDPDKFSAQYFGFFSCEGQGMDRIPASNSCVSKQVGRQPGDNSFRLDFDFLTGKPRP